MSLESKSLELKTIVSTFDAQWFLGNLSGLMESISSGRAKDQLGHLSSPLRQLYYLGGLLVSSDTIGTNIQYSPEQWGKIVKLLNEIEQEYDKLFFPRPNEVIDEQWKHARVVAMPSFLAYFNQGPLNYEEQAINWVRDLFSQLDITIKAATGLITEDFIQFYESIDQLHQRNFQSYTTKHGLLRPNWDKYTKLVVGTVPGVPDFIREMGEKNRPLYTYMSDNGIINRFYPYEIATSELSTEKVLSILDLIATRKAQTDFLYYTATRPGNPLLEKPIIDIGDGMFQIFEVKQVIHSIQNLLENICSSTTETTTKLVDKKGKLLEARIVDLFKSFFKSDYEVYTGYYVDGCEQDILLLWKEYAFIIEAKGYNLREPLRDPERAFVRIKDDFNASIGYGYIQTKRVEQKFIDQEPLIITDNTGKLIKEIDTTQYEDNDFSIIVNLKSFGQIQNDLTTLLAVGEDESFPWAVKLDDLEVFLLTLIAQKKNPEVFVDFLLMRENLHGKLNCSDELEVCGGFLSGKLTDKVVEKAKMIATTPEFAFLFDHQYDKEMGFKNEKLLVEKRSGKYIFF